MKMVNTDSKPGAKKPKAVFFMSKHLERLVFRFDQIVEEEKIKEQVPIEFIAFGLETGLKGNA